MTDTLRLTFSNCRHQRLAAILHGEPSSTMAIACHGMLSTKDGPKHQLVAESLLKRGIPTLRFDFAGRGESDGRLWDMSYTHEIEDLTAAINYASKLGAESVGLFGSSMGGAVALMTAARDARVAAVATLAAVGHPAAIEERYTLQCRGWRERGYIELEEGKLGVGFLDDAVTHDTIAAVGVLDIPILVIHGECDEIVPVADAHDIAVAARNATLELIPLADHRLSNPLHLRPAIERVTTFLSHSLVGQ